MDKMDKYRVGFEKKTKPRQQEDGSYRTDPFKDSQEALRHAEFSARDREVFFSEAYSSILSDLFVAWLKSAPHEEKYRDFLYASAMALGSVKEKMIQIEMLGNNVKYINQKTVKEEGTENE